LAPPAFNNISKEELVSGRRRKKKKKKQITKKVGQKKNMRKVSNTKDEESMGKGVVRRKDGEGDDKGG
jgi:hypothetical protein